MVITDHLHISDFTKSPKKGKRAKVIIITGLLESQEGGLTFRAQASSVEWVQLQILARKWWSNSLVMGVLHDIHSAQPP